MLTCTMLMYDSILVPTDGSAAMDSVIDHANQLAQEQGASITFLYVVNTSSFGSLPMETGWETLTEELRAEGEDALEHAVDRVDVEADTLLEEGTPYEIITAEADDYDVIVMGTSGRGGLDRVVLGSVAERVVRHSPVPVLTVRIGGLSE